MSRPWNRAPRSALVLTMLLGGSAAHVHAQAAAGPGVRSGHSLVYHAQLQKLVLLGGDPEPHEDRSMDLWTWDGVRWERLSAEGPSARQLTDAAYDVARDRVVIFGGNHDGTPLRDSWEWSTVGWRAVADTAPSARDHHAMAYDPARHETVMFGGVFFQRGMMTPQWPTGTWEWDGAGWHASDASGPAGRARTAMVYDEARRHVLMYGGIGERPAEGQPQPFFDDTWAYDGSVWTLVDTAGPGARYAHAMAYDAGAGVVLLYGGATMTEYFRDMWQWDGVRWREIELSGPTPGPRYSPAMAYDPARGRVVLHGGYDALTDTDRDDIWEWDGTRWHDVTRR